MREPDGRREKINRAVREAGITERGLTENSTRVLERRYLSKDRQGRVQEDPEGMFRRVSGNLSQAEKRYGEESERERVAEEFYQVMRQLDFLPNSPTLMNAGRELQQLSACFVLPVEDSLDGIFTSVKQTALIHKSGGGTGFSFTRLRPEGDVVGSTGGVASGPVSFISAFDAGTEVVKQGSTRRGANMAILNIDHPDILRFIRVKREAGKLVNFNISVGVTGDFMQRWRRGEDYDLINPRTEESAGSLNAREVFREIVESAWATGDPGLVFLDRINDANPNPQLGRIESTNPCIAGDTLVMTREGPRRADSLVGQAQELLVDGHTHPTGPEGFFSTGVKPVVTIRTRSGRSLTLTADHLVARAVWEPYAQEPRRVWTPAGEIAPGEKISLHDHWEAHLEEETQPGQSSAKEALTPVFNSNSIVIDPRERNPGLYLRGLDEETLRMTQARLAYLGIQSNVVVTAGSNEQELELRGANVVAFALRGSNHRGAERHYLRELAEIVLHSQPEDIHRRPLTDVVESVEPTGEREVYDVQVPGINAFDANGLYVHNCGEQPLLPYESCNLGSVNLARMVRHDGDEPEIDWEKLTRVINTGVRMLDNVIDMNEFPLPEIEEMSRMTRRIGLGIMGWADLLVQLGIRYDSEEALELARELMGFIQEKAHQASAQLAGERGNFPAWEGSIYTAPMRNSAPVTIAPTGTISIIAGASSGIEPLFALSYVRNVMDNTRLVEGNPYFEAVARQEGFHSQELMERVAETGSIENIKEIPEWVRDIFRVSHDISPTWHVLMQAAFQAHTDNAVSKTINMDEGATVEDVQEAYLMAYTQNCKGITVYRDGSKTDQVLSAGAQREEAREGMMKSRERPKVMWGLTERYRTGHGNMYVTMNFDEDNNPFEMFAALGKAGGCDSANLEAVSKLSSLCLRTGVDPGEIIYHLQGITCCPGWDERGQIKSAPDAMAHMLRQWSRSEDGNGAPGATGRIEPGAGRPTILREATRPKCPDCNSPLVFTENCEACSNPGCGWNRCT